MIRWALILAMLATGLASHSQNRLVVDSLQKILKRSEVTDSVRSVVLNGLMQLTSKPELSIAYADSLLQLRTASVDKKIRANRIIGVAYRMKGELQKALEFQFLSAQQALENNEQTLLAEAYFEIGASYLANEDQKNALNYYNKSIRILRRINKKRELAINLLNTGFAYYSMNRYDTALLYYDEAGPIFDSVGLVIGQAYTIGNRALVFWKTGKVSKAKTDLLRAIDLLIPLGDEFGMADYHNQLGHIYLEQGQTDEAISHLQRGLDLALGVDLKEQIRDASLLLSRLYESQGDHPRALVHHQQYTAYKDSIQSAENTHKMADLRTAFEVSIKEKAIDALEKEKQLQQTYIAIALILLILAIVIILYFRQRFRHTRLLALSERKSHESEITDLLKSQETKALQAMVKGKEEERRHLARELHNHQGSLLAAVKVNLNGLEYQDHSKFDRIISLVDQASQDVRNLSHELNMGISEDFGLVPAVKELVLHLEKSKAIEAEFTSSLDDIAIDSESEILIYRIVQELISNVLKHANASKLSVSLIGFADEGLVNILVQDDGQGFVMKNTKKRDHGIGLATLDEMVHKLDGEMSIDSSPRGGTTVSIDLPITINSTDEAL